MKTRFYLLGAILTVLNISSVNAQEQFATTPSFEENFNSKKLSSDRWGIDVAEFKGHNVCFTNKNHSIRKGILTFNLKKKNYKGCAFTSSSIWTNPKNYTFGYGKLQIRARIPATDDCRPAMWLCAVNKTNGLNFEIDLLEHWPGQGPTKYQANVHLWGTIKGRENDHKQYPLIIDKFDITKWHIYTVEYTSTYIRMLVDDQEIALWKKGQLADWTTDIRYKLYLSLACSTTATAHPDKARTLPQMMNVDWIKYYKMN